MTQARPCTYVWQCGQSGVALRKDDAFQLLFCSNACQSKYHAHQKKTTLSVSYDEQDTRVVDRAHFRDLWNHHVALITQTLIAMTRDSTVQQMERLTTQLMINQGNIGDYLASVYGKPFGNSIAELLYEHVKLTMNVMQALLLFPHSADLIEEFKVESVIYDEWLKHALTVADALYARMVRPADLSTHRKLRKIMQSHVEMTLEQMFDTLYEYWSKAADAYRLIHSDIIDLADLLISFMERDEEEEVTPPDIPDDGTSVPVEDIPYGYDDDDDEERYESFNATSYHLDGKDDEEEEDDDDGADMDTVAYRQAWRNNASILRKLMQTEVDGAVEEREETEQRVRMNVELIASASENVSEIRQAFSYWIYALEHLSESAVHRRAQGWVLSRDSLITANDDYDRLDAFTADLSKALDIGDKSLSRYQALLVDELLAFVNDEPELLAPLHRDLTRQSVRIANRIKT